MENFECRVNKTDLANDIQYNTKQEAQAITDYNYLLQRVRECDEISAVQKESMIATIYEIIGDELDHQQKLKMLYTLITGIKENKD